jgi:hypothetical protein
MWLGYGISCGLLGFAALVFVPACSGQASNDRANEGVSYGSAGTPRATASSGAAGLASGGTLGNAGNAGAAGIFAQGGLASSAGTGGTNSGLSTAGFGGLPGVSAAASAGASSSAGAANGGGFNVAGAGGGSAAFVQVSGILGKNCGIKGCHADKQSPHFVPDAMLYGMLTGPNTVLAACDYTRLVEEGDPAKSALVRLMNRKCGSFTMPPSCNKTPCISAADLKTLSDWIAAGAPP